MSTTYIAEKLEDLDLIAGKIIQDNPFQRIFLLEGVMGAGKTTFTKGIAFGLDIFAVVNSPTFVIMKIYNGTLPLYHLDVYRLNNESGDDYLVEYFEAGGVSVVEWADNISELLPNEYLKIVIKDLGDEKRKFIFESNSTTYDKLIERVI